MPNHSDFPLPSDFHAFPAPSRKSARPKNERLAFEVLAVVEEIPAGRVATYGQIARLIGREKNARLVGSVLANAAYYGRYPCHWVVNATGRLAPGWAEQADLLRAEGVELKDETHVSLKQYLWDN
ncbi:MGMT family protein [Neisseria animalis]|uniref:DNA methyltransferase n=1 Tax=Neisseria animalis TaxID=492 RepID=A0A5P3MQS0_NEIAN|nr:MGMT family protein [Neisseria animalis]QEY23942.1 DNA methyltransferase [Neisseria animalis]ROW31660.1 DNA methyltransferase [Neisseria animalis]VEE05917.1 methylated-DNA--protein-cysteine methyltransferase [Neisseria animalis]